MPDRSEVHGEYSGWIYIVSQGTCWHCCGFSGKLTVGYRSFSMLMWNFSIQSWCVLFVYLGPQWIKNCRACHTAALYWALTIFREREGLCRPLACGGNVQLHLPVSLLHSLDLCLCSLVLQIFCFQPIPAGARARFEQQRSLWQGLSFLCIYC